MCGISGIFSKNKLYDSSIINSLESIKHRGPNNTVHASFIANDFHLFSSQLSSQKTQIELQNSTEIVSNNWIGFNRLSIIDLSDNSMQPFYDNDSQTAFLFNGEIYNYKELRENFLTDITFISDSDSEVVFQLYLKLGDDFIHHLRGMFVITLVNYSTNKLKVWRDRFGIKPFYYFLDEEKFIFSSEIKGIFATDFVKKGIDFKHLAYTYYLNTSFAPNTVYQQIKSLEAATKLTVNLTNFTCEKEIYWTLNYEPDDREIDQNEFLNDVKEVVELAAISDVKQAVMLSGGLDSGLLAYQFDQLKVDIDAITIYNNQVEEQNELEFAKSNAKASNLNLLAFEIDNNVNLQTIKEYCLAEEEPNSSPEPAYFLAKKAHENKYIVLQNALGLDELFYGYGYYSQVKKLQKIEPFLFKSFNYFLKGSKRNKYEEIATFGLETSPFVMRSFASWKEIKLLFKQYNSDNWEHPISVLMKQVKQNNATFESLPLLKKISYLDFYNYISSHHSFHSDQPSMKFETEMRFPYLDHQFVQKYFNCTNLDKGLTKENNKPFLRKNVHNILPKDVLFMPKKGFSMPVKNWLKDVNLELDFPELITYFGDEYKNWVNNPAKKWLMISTIYFLRNED